MALSIYYQNTRSIKSKEKTMEVYKSILCNNYSVICLCETWLDDTVLSAELFDDRYTVVRRDRDGNFMRRFNKHHGGGVLIALKNNLDFVVKSDWHSDYLEDLWVQIRINSTTIINICTVYVPDYLPSADFVEFIEKCNNILNTHINSINCILGDFNLRDINWSTDSGIPLNHYCDKSKALFDLFSLNNISQLNNIINHNNVILDLAITTHPDLLRLTKSIPISRLDAHHPPFELDFCRRFPCLSINTAIERLCFRKTNYEGCISELKNIDWHLQAVTLNCDELVNFFYETLHSLIEKYTPKVKLRNSSYPVWFSIGLRRCLRSKTKFHARYKLFGNPRDWDTFSALRSRSKLLLNKCFKSFIVSIESDLVLNIKSFWRYTKTQRITNNIPSSLFLNDRVATTGREIAELFADYFSSVYDNTNTPQYTADFPSSSYCITNFKIMEGHVLEKLRNIDLSKGAGPDGIPPIFIRLCASALVDPLTKIYNKSLTTGIFPHLWKVAKITPIHKSGDKKNIINYRPICILNWFAKIFESFVYEQIYTHINPLLNPNQHGFVSGKSTHTNLLVYTTYLCDSFVCGSQVDAIYTDFAKAFDRVNHSVLTIKAHQLGIHGNLLRWLASYLLNRSQLVALNGYESDPFIPLSGVPQGSNLGPLLFLMFVNDLLNRIDSPCLAYADDIKIFRKVLTVEDCVKLQNDINVIIEWCERNRMSLNNSKCQIITFTKKRYPIKFNYMIGGSSLTRVFTVRDLGVLFDSALSFRPHYDHICKSANKMLTFILRVAKPFQNIKSFYMLYNSLVRSVVEYCSSVWCPIYQIHKDMIESVQKRFLRAMCVKYGLRSQLPEYSDRLIKFNMISLEKRRQISDLCMFHKIVNGSADASLLRNVFMRVPSRSVRIPQLYCIPHSNNNVSSNNPISRMCRYYNVICSNHDIYNDSYGSFKRSLHCNPPT